MLIDNAVFRAQSFYIVFMYVVQIWKSYEGPKRPLILPHLVVYPNLCHIYPITKCGASTPDLHLKIWNISNQSRNQSTNYFK